MIDWDGMEARAQAAAAFRLQRQLIGRLIGAKILEEWDESQADLLAGRSAPPAGGRPEGARPQD